MVVVAAAVVDADHQPWQSLVYPGVGPWDVLLDVVDPIRYYSLHHHPSSCRYRYYYHGSRHFDYGSPHSMAMLIRVVEEDEENGRCYLLLPNYCPARPLEADIGGVGGRGRHLHQRVGLVPQTE